MLAENINKLKDKLNITLTKDQIKLFEEYEKFFLETNSFMNLISKNDEKYLFEKHIFDSLSLNLFFEKLSIEAKGSLLDIGTGGGFPSVPAAILFDELQIIGIDSIRKKINAIEGFREKLGLKNLNAICDRVENYQKTAEKFDFVTSRAVATMDQILKYAIPSLKPGGYFIAFKSKKAQDELKDAAKTLKFLNAKLVDTIEYSLPLDENFERNLLIIKKNK